MFALSLALSQFGVWHVAARFPFDRAANLSGPSSQRLPPLSTRLTRPHLRNVSLSSFLALSRGSSVFTFNRSYRYLSFGSVDMYASVRPLVAVFRLAALVPRYRFTALDCSSLHRWIWADFDLFEKTG